MLHEHTAKGIRLTIESRPKRSRSRRRVGGPIMTNSAGRKNGEESGCGGMSALPARQADICRVGGYRTRDSDQREVSGPTESFTNAVRPATSRTRLARSARQGLRRRCSRFPCRRRAVNLQLSGSRINARSEGWRCFLEDIIKRLHITARDTGAGDNDFRSIDGSQRFWIVNRKAIRHSRAPTHIFSFSHVAADDVAHCGSP